jgi:ATP-dependent DNA helicase RecG
MLTRFGVEQRSKLWKKSNPDPIKGGEIVPPHVLVMTATIPRTLAMSLMAILIFRLLMNFPRT